MISKLIGRDLEKERIQACLKARRNVLLEGPVGVGKTHLALSICESLKRPVFRVDGDSRYTEQKLTGWFDPPTVIQKGYQPEAFIPGPLVEAMKTGGVLFINELNRLPEGVQNVLLPAIDEKMIILPRLGEVRAKEDFLVIATQNPKEFVATSHLSEAILDRFELIALNYQSEDEEKEIVTSTLKKGALSKSFNSESARVVNAAVRLARLTRHHDQIRRGASVRAAQSIGELCLSLMSLRKGSFESSFVDAVIMALPTRIEIEHELEGSQNTRDETERLAEHLAKDALSDLSSEKKN